VQMEIEVDNDSPLGVFSGEAVATGTCGAAGMLGRVRLDAPEVSTVLLAAGGASLILPRVASEGLAFTGGLLAVLPALSLLGAGGLLWRLGHRKRRS
jgi:hypothetical protein